MRNSSFLARLLARLRPVGVAGAEPRPVELVELPDWAREPYPLPAEALADEIRAAAATMRALHPDDYDTFPESKEQYQ